MSVVSMSTGFVSPRHRQRPFSAVPVHPPPPPLKVSAAGFLPHCRQQRPASNHGKPNKEKRHLHHHHDHHHGQPCCRPPGPSFDVFLSFHGRDVRHKIVDHLYAALIRKGIRPFKDDMEMPRGRDVKTAISAAIQQSSLYLFLLSRGYASSAFCMDEAAEIKKRCCCRCCCGSGLALPIFYLVSPEDACFPTAGCFQEDFRGHARTFTYERVQGWIEAFSWVGNISGFVHENGRSEALLVEEVSTTIGKMIREMKSATSESQPPSSTLLHLASPWSSHHDDQHMVRTCTMWVRLYNVPEEYMNPKGLSYIASALGHPITTADGFYHIIRYSTTGRSQQIRPPYAKVCVEISLEDREAILTCRPAAERTVVIAVGDEKENLAVVTAVYQLLDECGGRGT